jgi:KipI family sensor histidine kinase inhibitor
VSNNEVSNSEMSGTGGGTSRRLLPYGDHGVLVECADLQDTQRLLAALTQSVPPEVSELVPGARTVLLILDRPLGPASTETVLTASADSGRRTDHTTVTIPVHYDGDDLDEVAGILGLSPDQLVAAHTGQLWTVAFCGFAPGFGYLLGDGALPEVPRRSSPRTRVPAGAVGLAGPFSGVYPREGPGGWQLIGRTDLVLWDTEREPPTLLSPGTRVQFVDADEDPSDAGEAGAAPRPEPR